MRILSSLSVICMIAVTYCVYQWGYSELACWFLGLSYGWSTTSLWFKESRIIEDNKMYGG